MNSSTFQNLKPVVKWVGGKSQLLPDIIQGLPVQLSEKKITRYIEPFVGGGAVFFSLAQKFHFKEIILGDLNADLLSLYKIIGSHCENLIELLKIQEQQYLELDESHRREYYFNIRREFNQRAGSLLQNAAYFLFLNRTCFNGLYRVNSKGEFNVPPGRYKKPNIAPAESLRLASKALKQAHLQIGDFEDLADKIDDKTFVYYDPPYRPLAKTSCFTQYSRQGFDDGEQIRLANFFQKMSLKGAKQMLSNSDPQSIDPGDTFFTKLYMGNDIKRVLADRRINSRASGRGPISELLITNYSRAQV